jgi:hypothetical protein
LSDLFSDVFSSYLAHLLHPSFSKHLKLHEHRIFTVIVVSCGII